jgi:signal transduction histidine kinase
MSRGTSVLRGLRVKIVAAVAGVGAVVLVAALAAIVAVSCRSAYSPIQADLERAVQRGPEQPVSFSIGTPARGADRAGSSDGGGPAAGDDRGSLTPVALALVGADGQVQSSNDVFAGMDAAIRTAALEQALASSSDQGLLRGIGVFYLRSFTADGTLVAVADASVLMGTVRDTLAGAAAVAVGAEALIVALGLVVARSITRPVKRAWDRQTEFVADASHELKTPLTVILANTDILLAHPELTVAEQRRWVAGTREEATHMKGLVEEMLFLARSDEHALAERAEHRPVDFSQVVARALLAFDAVAFEAGVELEARVAPGVQVSGDEAQLERLVKTLVDNAVKYAGASGRVEVALVAGKRRGRCTFTVSNTGPAIASEDLPRLFDRFWRSDAARERVGEGSYGLGLSIAKSIVEAHAGTIEVQSAPGQPTVFTVCL